jgi:hypothetical protein
MRVLPVVCTLAIIVNPSSPPMGSVVVGAFTSASAMQGARTAYRTVPTPSFLADRLPDCYCTGPTNADGAKLELSGRQLLEGFASDGWA